MELSGFRYSFPRVVIHWFLTAMVFAALGLGWLSHSLAPAAAESSFYLDLHISLGLTTLILAVLQLGFSLIGKPLYREDIPRWRVRLDRFLETLIYTVLMLMLISGYLEMAAHGMRVHFWGLPMPVWPENQLPFDESLWRRHGMFAWVLLTLIAVHIVLSILSFGRQSRTLDTMLMKRSDEKQAIPQAAPDPQFAKQAQKLAGNYRMWGWLSFWVQLLLAILTGLLLSIAISGSPSGLGTLSFGDSKFWAGNGYILLCFAIIFSFYYAKTAVKVPVKPDFYLNSKRKIVFWILGVGMLTGLLGLLVSFAGIMTSILLLITKTVSQPPGIAITNPTTIIRALDVFILLVNFILLIAHFVGTAVSFWLSHRVTRCRHECSKIAQCEAQHQRTTPV